MITWLASTDFSRCAAAAVHQAARDLVERGGGRLVILHVLECDYLPSQFDDAHYRSLIEHHARKRLALTVGHIQEQYPDLDVVSDLRDGAVVDSILRAADQFEVSQVAIGTHSSNARDYDVVGSVAERVARASVVPVLIVKEAPHTTGLFELTQQA